jgi:hypothetical protein
LHRSRTASLFTLTADRHSCGDNYLDRVKRGVQIMNTNAKSRPF